jgi:hypothetical protein
MGQLNPKIPKEPHFPESALAPTTSAEGIECAGAGPLEIGDIPCYDGELMFEPSRRQQAINGW